MLVTVDGVVRLGNNVGFICKACSFGCPFYTQQSLNMLMWTSPLCMWWPDKVVQPLHTVGVLEGTHSDASENLNLQVRLETSNTTVQC